MKFLLFFGFILLLAKITLSARTIQQQWSSFRKDHERKYSSKIEEDRRYKIFQNNLRKIDKHNEKYESGKSTYFEGVNSFADKTFEEYLQLVFKEGNYSFRANINESHYKEVPNYVKPEILNTKFDIDWTAEGAVTEVKDQGVCGSCYAFAAIGALESAQWKLTGKLVTLSEQNIVDCAKPFGNNGCHGGLPHKVFNYIVSNGGVDTDESYPYEGIEGECRFKEENIGAKLLKQAVLPQGDEEVMAQALKEYGPLPVALDAGYLSFQFYAGGVLFEPQCTDSYKINHAVLAVGYGTQNGVDFWKIKNSFGKGWGDKGYVLIARGYDRHCGIGQYAVAITAGEEVEETKTKNNSNNLFNQNFITFTIVLLTSLNIIKFFN